MKKIIIMLVLTVFTVSCASNSNSGNRVKNIQVSQKAKLVLADKDSDEKVICRQIKRTGSNRISTVCEAASVIEERRISTQNELQKRSGRGSVGIPGN